tara:strand:- start:657 stop:1493 length:837 start_codon:yes stop_codon:yes gene_type:complete
MKRKNKRHNKKRNTAFLFEMLVREMAVHAMNKDEDKRQRALEFIKGKFNKSTNLYRELELYRTLLETNGLKEEEAQRLLSEVSFRHRRLIDPNGLFQEQSSLLKDMNEEFGDSVFRHFVKNYKSLANISQMFSVNTTPQNRMLLEKKVLSNLTHKEEKNEELEHIDEIVYNQFTKKFNGHYGSELLEEQRNLLGRYVMSFVDNSMDLKIFLEEEIGRLKEEVRTSLQLDEVKNDKEMLENTNRVLDLLEDFSQQHIDEEMLKNVLKIQNLVHEVSVDG